MKALIGTKKDCSYKDTFLKFESLAWKLFEEFNVCYIFLKNFKIYCVA